MIQEGEYVYILPEYINKVNPLRKYNSDGKLNPISEVNLKPWKVLKSYITFYDHNKNLTSNPYNIFAITSGSFWINDVREEYLISIDEFRKEKINTILNE